EDGDFLYGKAIQPRRGAAREWEWHAKYGVSSLEGHHGPARPVERPARFALPTGFSGGDDAGGRGGGHAGATRADGALLWEQRAAVYHALDGIRGGDQAGVGRGCGLGRDVVKHG